MVEQKKKTRVHKPAQNTRKTSGVNQIAAVIVFAVSAFVFALAVYPGEHFWNNLHGYIFGAFGFLSYLIPLFSVTVTVIYSMERLSGSIRVKTVEIGVLLFLAATAIDIFSTTDFSGTYGAHLAAVFNAASFKNGGVLGGLLGNALCRLFGKTGAVIFIIILAVALMMLMLGTSVARLANSAYKPMKRVSEAAGNVLSEVRDEKKKAYRVDIPVDDAVAEKELSLSEKQKKVVAAYCDTDESVAVLPEKKNYSSETSPHSNAATVVSEKVVLTAEENKQEIANVEKEITSGITITEDEGYKYPPISLLNSPKRDNTTSVTTELDSTASRLVEVLRSFGVETKIVDICRGPTVTRYELQPCAGVKISKITGLSDDIALNLATADVRIEAPIPNKAAVGIEVPNRQASVVCVREIIESAAFQNAKGKLTVAMGKDIAGNPIVTDVAKMPHGLIAGATGSGKSVCINSFIMSILYKASPEEVKLLLIDPKVVELAVYNGIPHLLVPVVTDPRKASGALGWAVTEMERRYHLFADNNVRDLTGFNRLCELDCDLQKLPQIVIIIDELADLMMTAPGEVEDSINRIAAKARAAGMHLLIATQRPSVDVVTGVIKANIPTRIAFAVSSQIDSRTILDIGGAEKLLGHGDMLFNPVGASKPNRLQGCYVSDSEVEAVVEYIKGDHSSDYSSEVQSEIDRLAVAEKKGKSDGDEDSNDDDSMLMDAVHVVVELGQASTSLLQRKLKLGYSRAARIMDQMEAHGYIGPYEGSKPRSVLIGEAQLLEIESRAE